MPSHDLPGPETCHCLAVRQAARRVSQFYDQFLAPVRLRTTQYSILAKLKRQGPMTINGLAQAMIMDRTTLGRNALPLEREGLIEIRAGDKDRRKKVLRLTQAGSDRLKDAYAMWTQAQTQFEAAFGERSRVLRGLLHELVAIDLEPGADDGAGR